MNFIVIIAVNFAINIKSFALAQDDIFPMNLLIPDNHKFVKNIKKTPYVAAVLRRGKLIRTGVLIDSQWVLTTADDLYIYGELLRQLRVRLGSINYNKKGHLIPVRKYEIHPHYEDQRPEYDVALLQLAYVVDDEASILPIQMRPMISQGDIFKMPEKFTVVGYEMLYNQDGPVLNRNDSIIFSLMASEPLRVDTDICDDYLYQYDVNFTSSMLCLEPLRGRINCRRETGGAVVIDNVLWGIVSSWLPFECNTEPTPTLVMQLSDRRIGEWIQDVIFFRKLSQAKTIKYSIYSYETRDFSETTAKSQLLSSNSTKYLNFKNIKHKNIKLRKSKRRNNNSSKKYKFKQQFYATKISPQVKTKETFTRLFHKVTH